MVEAKTYDPWGREAQVFSSSEGGFNRYGFTGHEYDPETELTYAKARYCDQDLGVFASMDRWDFAQFDMPPSLHRYQYANRNPLRFIDPTGNEGKAADAETDKDHEKLLKARGIVPGTVNSSTDTAVKVANITTEFLFDITPYGDYKTITNPEAGNVEYGMALFGLSGGPVLKMIAKVGKWFTKSRKGRKAAEGLDEGIEATSDALDSSKATSRADEMLDAGEDTRRAKVTKENATSSRTRGADVETPKGTPRSLRNGAGSAAERTSQSVEEAAEQARRKAARHEWRVKKRNTVANINSERIQAIGDILRGKKPRAEVSSLKRPTPKKEQASVTRKKSGSTPTQTTFKRDITTVLDDDGSKLLNATTKKRVKLEIMFDEIREGNTPRLKGVHIDGARPGEVGLKELNELIRI
ncbi:RHS repeat-associated core domain-containing protein [Sulfidibacter corallicola]|uniref:RHS repeat-associated core domain-containing protein n=1 Tax=Sulfidibacter corallicola TaxID=2818388 RepID=A0A8A4TJT5_SULCO|nr:RHS repeat-associated core domain-containing protein [Sulfidibacter corallicola]QTD49412.1 hypothetical protein J3U87_27825 [Sulfidibacter corallicola]